ncbi:hypothetical protein STEG23_019531, partial [Scotinomys teguina]
MVGKGRQSIPREQHYQEVWSCWRKCVTVGVSFEVSYAQAAPSVAVDFLMPVDQDVDLSASSPARLPARHYAAMTVVFWKPEVLVMQTGKTRLRLMISSESMKTAHQKLY